MPSFEEKFYAGPHNDFCVGYLDDASYNSYVLLSNLATVSIPRRYSSTKLDQINAFDSAEVKDANFGQVNLINVSSFCGPNGKIAGIDFLQEEPRLLTRYQDIPVYSGDILLQASRKIIGTVADKKFPLFPGSHVPAASQVYYQTEPGRVYAIFAVAIPRDREQYACLLMEDTGSIKDSVGEIDLINEIIDSTLFVCENQGIICEKIFVSCSVSQVQEGEIGCGLVMLPYVKLARNFFSSPYFKS